MYEIEIKDSFQASHFLKLQKDSWENPHKHQWIVAVTVRSRKLDPIGVVADFEELKPLLKDVLADFNQKTFNHHPEFRKKKLNPSTENIAKVIYDRLKKSFRSKHAKIVKVTVWETPDASASFYA